MRKPLKEEFKTILAGTDPKELNNIKNRFTDWERNHALRKNSWFWSDNGNASERRYKEKRYTFDEMVTIGNYRISYRSNCRMSRQNVYWTDGLIFSGKEDVSVTFADIRFLQDTIEHILTELKEDVENSEPEV